MRKAIVIQFDARLHPRDARGRFRRSLTREAELHQHLASLPVGGLVQLPHDVRVRRVRGLYRIEGGRPIGKHAPRGPEARVTHVYAARRALERHDHAETHATLLSLRPDQEYRVHDPGLVDRHDPDRPSSGIRVRRQPWGYQVERFEGGGWTPTASAARATELARWRAYKKSALHASSVPTEATRTAHQKHVAVLATAPTATSREGEKIERFQPPTVADVTAEVVGTVGQSPLAAKVPEISPPPEPLRHVLDPTATDVLRAPGHGEAEDHAHAAAQHADQVVHHLEQLGQHVGSHHAVADVIANSAVWHAVTSLLTARAQRERATGDGHQAARELEESARRRITDLGVPAELLEAALGRWEAGLHPRDRRGRWIDVPEWAALGGTARPGMSTDIDNHLNRLSDGEIANLLRLRGLGERVRHLLVDERNRRQAPTGQPALDLARGTRSPGVPKFGTPEWEAFRAEHRPDAVVSAQRRDELYARFSDMETGAIHDWIRGVNSPWMFGPDLKAAEEELERRGDYTLVDLSKPSKAETKYDRYFHAGDDTGQSVNIAELLATHPRLNSEALFEYQSRICMTLTPSQRHRVLYRIRERYPPCPFIVAGARRWRKELGLPEPNVDISEVPAPLAKGDRVGRGFEVTPDAANDPRVRAAFADFKRQNQEMWDFMTRPESEGGLGITVTVRPFDAGEAYPSATEQADDLRRNRHIRVQSGLGGDHALMTTEEYDRFRAVHDVFGHAGVGGGFDRHGEYEAWLAHMTMYTPPGRDAMSSEYHGVNSALWAGSPGTPGTGKAILLDPSLIRDPWDDKGNLVREARAANPPDADDIGRLIRILGLGPAFANRFDRSRMHGGRSLVEAAFRSDLHPRDRRGRFKLFSVTLHPRPDAFGVYQDQVTVRAESPKAARDAANGEFGEDYVAGEARELPAGTASPGIRQPTPVPDRDAILADYARRFRDQRPDQNVGVTPYRGRGDADTYRGSTRYKSYLTNMVRIADEENVRIKQRAPVDGVWEGQAEPADSVWVAGTPESVRRFARRVGKRYNQDSVMIVRHDDDGPGVVYSVAARDRTDATEVMRRLGAPGGRFDGTHVEVAEPAATHEMREAAEQLHAEGREVAYNRAYVEFPGTPYDPALREAANANRSAGTLVASEAEAEASRTDAGDLHRSTEVVVAGRSRTG